MSSIFRQGFFASAVFAALVLGVSAAEPTEPPVRLRTATIWGVDNGCGPAIDGELDEIWNEARVYPVDRPVRVDNEPENHGPPLSGCRFAADFRMLYDGGNLYVFIDVTDSTPNHNTDLSWQFSDNVVLYIDALNKRYLNFGRHDYEYAFLWDEAEPRAVEWRWSKMYRVEYAMKTTDKGYCVEARIPWQTLGTPLSGYFPSAGTVLGIDVQVSDNQGGERRNAMLGWQDDTNGAWEHPCLFGRAELAQVLGDWPNDNSAVTEGPDGRLCILEATVEGHDALVHGNVLPVLGQPEGMVLTENSSLNALEFDGKDSYLTVKDEPVFDVAGEFTVECWALIDSVTTDEMPIVTKGNSSWHLTTAGHEARFQLALDDDADGGRVCTTKPVELQTWHHIAGTYDGKVIRLYIDGVLDAENPYDGGIALNDCPMMIAANAEAMEHLFHGVISNIRVYSYARSAKKIRSDASWFMGRRIPKSQRSGE